jgi:hypothetical protein
MRRPSVSLHVETSLRVLPERANFSEWAAPKPARIPKLAGKRATTRKRDRNCAGDERRPPFPFPLRLPPLSPIPRRLGGTGDRSSLRDPASTSNVGAIDRQILEEALRKTYGDKSAPAGRAGLKRTNLGGQVAKPRRRRPVELAYAYRPERYHEIWRRNALASRVRASCSFSSICCPSEH